MTHAPRPPLPRRFWLLPLLALAVWWPRSPYWASDDFVAMHYAQDLRRVLSDFVGPQYGAADLWAFYRPLITLSFWIDGWFGDAAVFASHLSNVLAHATSALLVGCLWRPLLGDHRAFLAALLWSMMPGHAASIAWAVGRVDSHTTVWCLLSLWLLQRQAASAQPHRTTSVLALLAALCSKELAFVVPPLATVLMTAMAPAGPLRQRIRHGIRLSWPLWLLLTLFLPARWWALGRFGGYLGASYDPVPMALGFGRILLDLLAPLRWCGHELLEPRLGAQGTAVWWLGLLPIAVAVGYWLGRGRRLAMLAAALAFLAASAPMAAFFAGAGNQHNLRYFYLPTAVLVGLLAGPGRIVALLLAVTWLPALLQIRALQRVADQQSATLHAAILQRLDQGATAPLFVAGLPHHDPSGHVIQLHFGVDRMTHAPFHASGARLLPLRPADTLPLALRLWPEGEAPFALPSGTTLALGADGSSLPLAAGGLPPLAVRIDDAREGVLDCTTPNLERLARADDDPQRWRPAVRFPGDRSPLYRITYGTAVGYFSTLFGNQFASETDGGFALRDHFATARWAGAGPPQRLADPATARSDPNDHYLLDGLCVPTVHDLDLAFPVLFEALTLQDGRVVPTARATALWWFRFDRALPAFVRRLKGQ